MVVVPAIITIKLSLSVYLTFAIIGSSSRRGSLQALGSSLRSLPQKPKPHMAPKVGWSILGEGIEGDSEGYSRASVFHDLGMLG